MKKEIEVLQKKAAEIAAFFYSNSNVYVRSGEQIFNLNCNDVEDTFIEGCIADRNWLKFEWYLNELKFLSHACGGKQLSALEDNYDKFLSHACGGKRYGYR